MKESFIDPEVISTSKKLKGRFAPISELIHNVPKSLTIREIYKLKEELKDLYLINVNNYSNKPKIRYFLAVMLASQSSDFLVSLAKDFANKNNLKLIQYSLYPKSLRINLISLKEILNAEDFSSSIKILEVFKKDLRKKIMKIRDLVESEP